MTKTSAILTLTLLTCLAACGQITQEMPTHTNDLIHETSPYLLQHAHNPVDWHAWTSENIKEAQEKGLPLLISIGYSSCHWCHVMEHESFEDEVVAEYMNKYFYCIKVDREERPDVDQVYMTAANIITGSGGWPLNCFALPDGRPFHAGTYFPKDNWLQLLKNVHDQFNSNNEKIVAYAENLTRGIALQETALSDNVASKLSADILESAVSIWKKNWDMEEGGMNRVPKFPMPANYEFLLKFNDFEQDSETDSFINLTLKKMAYGGIFDQIGGGFSRYSTDGFWKVPHFEKMLYDNAQLLKIYALAYAKYKDPLYSEVIDKTKSWLKREMLHESGLFYSALDADSEGEEGKFYVWKDEELENLLEDEYELAQFYYQLNGKGLWEHGNNILVREHDTRQMATMFQMSEDKIKKSIAEINKKLLDVRSKRIAPGLDDKCLTSWNGLMLEGLAQAYIATGDDDLKQMAIKCGDAILSLQMNESGIWHSFKEGKSTITGMLEDYCFPAIGLIKLFEVTGDQRYYNAANTLCKMAVEKFYDADKGLFYFNEANELIVRTSEIYDNVIPSSNAAMTLVLYKLGLLEGNTSYLEISTESLAKIQDNIPTSPGGHAYWAVAHLMKTKPYYEVVILGSYAEELKNTLLSKGVNNAIFISSEGPSDLPIFKDRFVQDKTLIYVCKQGVCSLPKDNIDEALALIAQ